MCPKRGLALNEQQHPRDTPAMFGAGKGVFCTPYPPPLFSAVVINENTPTEAEVSGLPSGGQ